MPASGRAKIDYTAAERLYVTTDLSIREVARQMGLSAWSSMAAIAKRDDWKGKRQAYKNSIARRSYENMAAQLGEQMKAIESESIVAGRLTIQKYIAGLQDGSIRPTSKDTQLWAAFLLSEMTSPGRDTSSEVPEVRNVTPLDDDLLRRVVEAARQHVDPAGSVGPAPLVLAQGPRTN